MPEGNSIFHSSYVNILLCKLVNPTAKQFLWLEWILLLFWDTGNKAVEKKLRVNPYHPWQYGDAQTETKKWPFWFNGIKVGEFLHNQVLPCIVLKMSALCIHVCTWKGIILYLVVTPVKQKEHGDCRIVFPSNLMVSQFKILPNSTPVRKNIWNVSSYYTLLLFLSTQVVTDWSTINLLALQSCTHQKPFILYSANLETRTCGNPLRKSEHGPPVAHSKNVECAVGLEDTLHACIHLHLPITDWSTFLWGHLPSPLPSPFTPVHYRCVFGAVCEKKCCLLHIWCTCIKKHII